MDPTTPRTIRHSAAELGAKESDEQVFELAEECEVLFIKHISKLYDCEEPDGARFVLELYQRFTASAASLGIFGESHPSLMHNVQQHFDIKDQLLRLLDILQRNLTYLLEPDQSSEHMSIDSINGSWLSPSNAKLSISSLEAISEAVDRLNTLGNLIQRSSLVSQPTKVRESAGNLHLKSFEKVAYLSLQALYGDASQSLLKQLAESMAEMYARILQRKPRQARLNAFRPRLHVLDPLYLTLKNASVDLTSYKEEDRSTQPSFITPEVARISPFSEATQSGSNTYFPTDPGYLYLHEAGLSSWNPLQATTPVDTAARIRARRGTLTDNERARIRALRAAGGRCEDCRRRKKRCCHVLLESQELDFKFKKSSDPSLKKRTMSVLENLTEYPRPPKGILACDWCSSLVSADTMDEGYWRQHVHKDNEPYVCLSEKCSETLPKFANLTEWFQHMLDIHGRNWHQEIYPPSLWICPLCMEKEMTFSKSNDLKIHFDTVHQNIFTQHQAQAIIQRSRIQTSRPRDSCPLCCVAIKADDDYQSEQNDNGNNETVVQNLPEDTSSNSKPGLWEIGNHVAVHLESIMVLTLRLISINGADDNSNNNQSTSNLVDHSLSWMGSWMDSDKAGFGFSDEMSTGDDQDISNSTWDTKNFDS